LRRLGALVGALVGALDGDRAGAVATRLRLGNADRRRLVSMTAEPADLDADDRSVRAAIYGLGVERWRDRVLITAARAGAEQERLDRLLAVADGWPVPTLPIAGRDLLALGLDPGERVGKILGRVERWWIDGDFQADRTACLDQAARLIGEDGYEL
jgi:poly(A) polymerase